MRRLSRLVRDNGYSTEYAAHAARLLDQEDGQCCIAYVLHRIWLQAFRTSEVNSMAHEPKGFVDPHPRTSTTSLGAIWTPGD